MFGGFVHPGLVAGALLASVPLIIHLMNRQRYKPMPWAAMRFVLAAYRKTRRQVQLENLLLLLLRMAAVALLALAIARPFASGESPLARLTEKRHDLVAILDGSASTGYRSEIETTFERIVERSKELIEELDGGRGDRVRLILAGSNPRLLSWTTPEAALSILATLHEPTHESLDLAAALAEVRAHAERQGSQADGGELEVLLLTDLQRRSFEGDLEPSSADEEREGAPVSTGNAALLQELDALQALGLSVLVEDMGPAESTPSNLAIRALEMPAHLRGAGVPQEVRVIVSNHGPARRSSVRVALELDGNRLPSQRVDVEGRSDSDLVFTVKFESAGPHSLVALLEGDKLEIDDRRAQVVHVPPALRVLVVNGEPRRRLVDDETGYLMALLEPSDDSSVGGGAAALFDPREIEVPTLSDSELELGDYDVVVLANVQAIPESVVRKLEEATAAGTALVFFLGPRVDLADYNAKMFRSDASGLLPAELLLVKQAANPRESYYRVGWFDASHPCVDFFAEDRFRPLLSEVPVHAFVQSRPLEMTRVYARLDDEDTSPLMMERSYDKGRVVMWTTSIDRAWSRIPDSPRTFLPLMHLLLAHVGQQGADQRNLPPQAQAHLLVEGFPREAELVRPDGSRRSIDGEAERSRGDLWALPTIPSEDTAQVGLYQIELAGGRKEAFAIQLDYREGDLDRLSAAELTGLHSALRHRENLREGSASEGPRQGELWRWLALACILSLVCESLWAAWLGAKRRVIA